MGGIATEEKLSQGMARFRQIEATWDREDTERWVLLRRLLPSLRTSFELPTAQRCVEELLRKADSLCVTTIATITEVPAELASAVHAGDRPAVNAIFKKYTGKSGSGKKQNKGQVCWYLDKFSDDSLCYSGPPTLPAVRSNLPQRTPCPARGTFEPSTADPPALPTVRSNLPQRTPCPARCTFEPSKISTNGVGNAKGSQSSISCLARLFAAGYLVDSGPAVSVLPPTPEETY